MVDRKLLKTALSELARLKNSTQKPTCLIAHLYASALEEWADRLDVDPPKLNKLVLVREAVSSEHLH
jgi:phytoene/squalene synthetase